MSWAYSFLSKPIETLISAMIAAGPAPKRPPHMALAALRSVSLCWLSFRSTVLLPLLGAWRLVFLALLVVGTPTAAVPLHYPPVGDALQGFILERSRPPAPTTPFFTADGTPQHLETFQGQALLINFWASWCAPCIEELPALGRLQAALGGPTFQMLAINEDGATLDKARALLARLPDTDALTLFRDSGMALAQAFGVRALPTTVLLDRQHRIVGTIEGPAPWDPADARRLIAAIANPARPNTAAQD